MISERSNVTKSKKLTVDIPSYRAFNFHTKEMIYFYKDLKPTLILIILSNSWAIYPAGVDISGSNSLVHSNNGILMRGSGHRDISGLEIYEKDIVRNLISDCNIGGVAYAKAEVYFKNGLFYENYLNQPLYTYPNLEVLGNTLEDSPNLNRGES